MTDRVRQKTYPIRVVSRMTGLGIDTLRAWERRHGAVTPSRDERGRLYSDADVRRLRLLRAAVEQGHAIGRVARLSIAELEQFEARNASAARPLPERPPDALQTVDREAIRNAMTSFDQDELESALGRAAAVLKPSALVKGVLMPLLADVGDAWCTGEASVAQEHLVSGVVRNILGSLLHLHTAGQGARLLFATPIGERHELGVLGAAVLAASEGLDAIYLGAEVPAEDLVRGAADAGADALVLGVTGAVAIDALGDEARDVARSASPDVEIWLAGPAAAALAESLGSRVEAISEFDELERHFARIAAGQ